jgi:hypothetical protein
LAVVISKRERYIGFGVAAALALLAVDRYALTPYTERSKQVTLDREAIAQKAKEADLTFAKKRKLQKTWDEVRKSMKADPSEAEGQARTALRECAEAAGVTLGEVNADRSSVPQEGFRVINLRVSVTGRTATISHMLWQLETMPIPLRIASMDLSARPENSDELRLEMTVSTLVTPAETERPRQQAVAWTGGVR